LTVDVVDMEMLAEALAEGDRGTTWWFHTTSGDVRAAGDWSDGFDDADLVDQGWVIVPPSGGRTGFEDMELFAKEVGDVRAREQLMAALEGKGAFRRFRDAVRDRPELRDAWRDFQVAREDARAVRWLLAHDHVDELDADDALAARRQRATAALDCVRALGGLSVDVADAPARWAEVASALDAGATVMLLRDGRAFAAVQPFETKV
jgi:hypothetical protein